MHNDQCEQILKDHILVADQGGFMEPPFGYIPAS